MLDKELDALKVVLRYLDREQAEFEKHFPDAKRLPLWEHCDTLQEYLDYEHDMKQEDTNTGYPAGAEHINADERKKGISNDAKRAAHYASEKEKG